MTADLLAPIRKRVEAFRDHGTPGLHAPQDRSRILAALDGVLALHTPEDDPDHSYAESCHECLDTWPCPTVAAVVAALQEGDK